MGNTHDDVARRWANRIIHPGRDALKSHNLLDRGDNILSYGSHFEVGRILRNRKGEPEAWLLNGNTYSPTTSRHQSAVRSAVQSTGLPVVTIPHAALAAAGIDLRTVQIIDVQPDWWAERVLTTENARKTYSYPAVDDRGGWQNTLTGEIVMREDWYTPKPTIECDHTVTLVGPWNVGYDGAPAWNWEYRNAHREAVEVHKRARHGVWEELRSSKRETGHVIWKTSLNVEWDAVDDPEHPRGFRFERTIQRHWLGGSLIRAQVPYQVQVKHQACGGTGVSAEPWFVTSSSRAPVQGPLTEEQMQDAHKHNDFMMERNGGIRPPLGWPYTLQAYERHTECRGCSGRGRVPADRRRWAYFLSAFDENETRPSYFFCELPPKVHPTTVEEALEALKPEAVKLAEQSGREVKRQGDIFAIPMPGLTLRDLKAQGGRYEKRGNLLGTNHQASEVVYVGAQTYARGVLRHVPERRRPDHKQLNIGRGWSLIVKNTVPVSN